MKAIYDFETHEWELTDPRTPTVKDLDFLEGANDGLYDQLYNQVKPRINAKE